MPKNKKSLISAKNREKQGLSSLDSDYARETYLPSRVSIVSTSPSLMKSGT